MLCGILMDGFGQWIMRKTMNKLLIFGSFFLSFIFAYFAGDIPSVAGENVNVLQVWYTGCSLVFFLYGMFSMIEEFCKKPE